MKDFWDPVIEASVSFDDATPKFTVVFSMKFGNRTATIYLDESMTRKAAVRKLSEGMDSSHRQLIERIADDLFDKFGASGHLEYNEAGARRCNEEWTVRLLRRDLRQRGIPAALDREAVERVLDELYVVEPVLNS